MINISAFQTSVVLEPWHHIAALLFYCCFFYHCSLSVETCIEWKVYYCSLLLFKLMAHTGVIMSDPILGKLDARQECILGRTQGHSSAPYTQHSPPVNLLVFFGGLKKKQRTDRKPMLAAGTGDDDDLWHCIQTISWAQDRIRDPGDVRWQHCTTMLPDME